MKQSASKKKIVFEFVSSKFKCTVKDIEKEVKPCYDAQTHLSQSNKIMLSYNLFMR